MKDIDENLEDIEKEKEEYDKELIEGDHKSLLSKVKNSDNAYIYSKENRDRMEEINNSLNLITPMLPAPSDDPDYKLQFS